MAQRFLVYKDSSVHIPFGCRQPCEVGMQVLPLAPLPVGGDRGPAGSSAGVWVEPAGDGARIQLRSSERDPACVLFVPQVWA